MKVLSLSSTKKEGCGIAEYTRQFYKSYNDVSIVDISPLNVLSAPFSKAKYVHLQHEFFMFDRFIGVSGIFVLFYLKIFCKFAKKILITTIHSTYDLENLDKQFQHFAKYKKFFPVCKLYLKFYYRWISWCSDALVVISAIGLRKIRPHITLNKTYLLPIQNYYSHIKKEPSSNNLPIFGLFGFAFQSKNYELVLHAISHLMYNYPSIQLYIIAGTTENPGFILGNHGSPYILKLKALAQTLEIEEHVRFLGYIPFGSHLDHIFSLIKCFIFPYSDDRTLGSGSLSTVISAGKAVLVSKSPCFSEYPELTSFLDLQGLIFEMKVLMDFPKNIETLEHISKRAANKQSFDISDFYK